MKNRVALPNHVRCVDLYTTLHCYTVLVKNDILNIIKDTVLICDTCKINWAYHAPRGTDLGPINIDRGPTNQSFKSKFTHLYANFATS